MPAIAVGLLAIVLFFTELGDTSLPSKDDAYHAQTAKEMLHSGDPIGISYGGSYSFQSSPLPNWLIALSYIAFGVNEYAARFPSALLALLGILITYYFARRRWGEAPAVLASFILLTTFLYLRYARHAMAELPLTFFSTLALLAFIDARERKGNYRLFGLAVGLAVLTKSALGLLPLIIAGAHLLLTRQAKELLSRRFLIGVLIAAGVSAVWYAPALALHGAVFIESHFGAYLGVHTFSGHQADLGAWGLVYYLLWIPIQYLPWTLALLPALYRRARTLREDAPETTLWLAVLLPILLLSLITTKYTRYLIPIFPPAALLIVAEWRGRLSETFQKRAAGAVGLLCAVAAAGVIILPVRLSLERNDGIRALAGDIRAAVGPKQKIFDYRLDFYEYQNPLLFYTDRALRQPSDDAESIVSAKPGETRYGLTKADYVAELGEAAPPGVDVSIIRRAGELVFFSVEAIEEEVWAAELQSLMPVLKRLEVSGLVASYRIPRDDLNPLLKEELGVRFLRSANRPRQLFSLMQRQGCRTGVAWRGAVDSLMRRVPEGITMTVLTTTRRLALFILGNGGENPAGANGR